MEERSGAGPPLRLALRCRECGDEGEYVFERAYYEVGALRNLSEPLEGALTSPEEIVCRECGAVDQYELSALGRAAVVAKTDALRDGLEDPLPKLVLVDLKTERWGLLSPDQLLLRYEVELGAHGENVDLRFDYATVLRTLGYERSAMNVFVQVLIQRPGDARALRCLAEMRAESGASTEMKEQ